MDGRIRPRTISNPSNVPLVFSQKLLPGSPSNILAINGGSSSIKFAFYSAREPMERRLYGKLSQKAGEGMVLSSFDPVTKQHHDGSLNMASLKTSVRDLIDWLETQKDFASVRAIGHRVAHGMNHTLPELVTPELLDELRAICPHDPEHLPFEIELIEALQNRHPKCQQFVCFDTAFHASLPALARLLPIPRKYGSENVRRFGFHGLSYAYVMEEMLRLSDTSAVSGRVILAHLGSGASMTAVKDGESIETSMGFTPTGGLVMSTRTGELDPGLMAYMVRTEQMTASQFQRMVNHEAGLLGLSGLSSDMQVLLDHEKHDPHAAEAVELFCYSAKKFIGSFAAILDGLDTLVFTGGIGENSPSIRSRICEGLSFLGLEIHKVNNEQSCEVISTVTSQVKVRVIRTDEELMIARSARRVSGLAYLARDRSEEKSKST